MTGAVRGVQDLIVEHGEVECETKTDGMSGSQLGLRDIGSVLESHEFRGYAAVISHHSHLVRLVSSSCGNLALLA